MLPPAAPPQTSDAKPTAPAPAAPKPAAPTAPPPKESADLSAVLESAFEKKKPDDPKPTPENGKPDAGEAGNAPAPAVADAKPAAKPKPTAENNLAAMRQRLESAERERDELKAKSEKPQSIEEHPQFKTQAQRLVDLEKQYKEAAEALKYTNYVKSPEYRDKYKKPLENAWSEAYLEVESLTFTDAEGNERQASREQFNKLIQLPKKEAAAQAEEWFGRHMGNEMMQHRRNIEGLHRQAAEAVANFEQEGAKLEQQSAEQKARENEAIQKQWKAANDAVVEKFPNLCNPIEGDEKGNAILAQTRKHVDAFLDALVRGDPSVKSEKGISDFAVFRHSAIAAPRLVHQNKELKAELEKVKSDLAEFRNGDAADGKGAGRVDGAASEGVDALLESAFPGGRR